MINELLDKATDLQKQVLTLTGGVKNLRKENDLLKNKIEKLESDLGKSNVKRNEFKSILDMNLFTSGLEKKEDIRELRMRLNELIRKLDGTILHIEQQDTEHGK